MKPSHLSAHRRNTAVRRKKLPLAVVLPLSVGLIATGTAPAAFAEMNTTAVQTVQDIPQADLLDVTFEDGATDAAQGREVTSFGDPEVAMDGPLSRMVAEFDGDDAYSYPLNADDYAAMEDGCTVECSFMATAATSGEDTFCGNKEAGGWAMVVQDNRAAFMLHSDGGYTFAWADIDLHQWYHAVGVYDGENIQLYLDGELAAEAVAGGPMTIPPNETAHNMVIGADSGPNNQPGQHAAVKVDDARLFSAPLSAAQAAAMGATAFDGLRDQEAQLVSTTPADDSELTRATAFDVKWDNPELLAAGTTYTLNGEAIEPGDILGVGLSAGEHTIAVEGKTVFGLPISQTVNFTSGSIPEADGTQAGQGAGTVTLSAKATHPEGGEVTSTFYAGEAEVADGGFQGLVDETPSSLEFEYYEGSELDGSGQSLSAGQGQIAFQRFDVAVGEAADGQSVRWAGEVDPSRQVNVLVWNTDTETWDAVAAGRGLSDGELVLTGELNAEHLNADGTAAVMVTGEDPFADDLANEVADSFEDPDSYDFSIAHVTDTQYLTEGAVEKAYSAEQQAVWADAYTDTMEWIVDNADEHKIAYVTHTGDIIENWHTGSERDDEEAYRQIAVDEFEFASEAQKILDDAEIVNGVLPGNHDNRSGADVGADNLYNEYFHPDRYEALEQTAGWQDAQASYTPWRQGDNENHYDLFTAGGLDFIAVYLGFDVTQEELDWASEVLDQYSDRNAMVMTHAHRKPSENPDGRGATFSHDGSRIDQHVLKEHDNVFLVLSGHEHGVDIEVRRDVGIQGNNIVELLADYQFYEVSAEELGLTGIDGRSPDEMLRFGSSFFRMLQFDVDNAELAVDTYSPQLDNFGATEYDDRSRYNGTEDDTRLPIQLETRKTSFATEQVMVTTATDEVIGEATAASGWPASVVWSGLTEGETYAWYVVSRDAQTGDELPTGEAEQMGVFTATAAGTDSEAPELTIPDAATVVAGESFDAMDGVSAVDNIDGDLTGAVQVVGALDTATPGVYVLTYMVEDTNGNQATANRAVTITEATGVAPEEPSDQAGGQDGDQDDGSEDNSGAGDNNQSGGADDNADDATDVNDDQPGAGSTGGGTSGPDGTQGDASKAGGVLANTGAQGLLALVLGGLLSIGAGLTAWKISRRRKLIN